MGIMQIPSPGSGLDRLAVLAAGLVLMLPWLADGLPHGHSTRYNLIWSEAFASLMSEGHVYPRVLDTLWDDAGGLDFFFYAPLPFWITGTIRNLLCTDCSIGQAVVLTGTVLLTVSGLGFYELALRFAPRIGAASGAFVYMAMPYHLGIDWAERQAIGEIAAIAFSPWHVFGMLLCLSGRRAGVPLLTLATALILLSHLPSALILAIVYTVLGVVYRRHVNLAASRRILLSGLLGTGLAATYWLPAIALMDTVNSEFLTSGHFSGPEHLFGIDKILAPTTPFHLGLWTGFLFLNLLTVVAVVIMPRPRPSAVGPALMSLGVVWILILPISAPFWAASPLAIIQFPWRFFLVADLAVASIVAVTVGQAVWQSGRRRLPLALALIAFTAFAVAEHPQIRGSRVSTPDYELGMAMRIGAAEWLPAEVDHGPFEGYQNFYRWARDSVASRPAAIVPERVSHREYRFSTDLAATREVTIRKTYWRHWRLTELATGMQVPVRASAGFPLILAQLPPGPAEYRLVLPPLWQEIAGWLLSVLSLLGLVAACFIGRSRGDLADDG